jgi:hypothetical protein
MMNQSNKQYKPSAPALQTKEEQEIMKALNDSIDSFQEEHKKAIMMKDAEIEELKFRYFEMEQRKQMEIGDLKKQNEDLTKMLAQASTHYSEETTLFTKEIERLNIGTDVLSSKILEMSKELKDKDSLYQRLLNDYDTLRQQSYLAVPMEEHLRVKTLYQSSENELQKMRQQSYLASPMEEHLKVVYEVEELKKQLASAKALYQSSENELQTMRQQYYLCVPMEDHQKILEEVRKLKDKILALNKYNEELVNQVAEFNSIYYMAPTREAFNEVTADCHKLFFELQNKKLELDELKKLLPKKD